MAGSLEAVAAFWARWEAIVGGPCDAETGLIYLNAVLGLVVVDRTAESMRLEKFWV